MVRVNLFETAGPGIYGTATGKDILTVCGAAFLFCVGMGIVTFGAVKLLETLRSGRHIMEARVLVWYTSCLMAGEPSLL